VKKTEDRIPVTGNVTIAVRNGQGKVIEIRDRHNIFVDQGRQWLPKLASGDTVFGHAYPQVIGYMGFGKGGALQDVPAERTAQTENSSVTDIATIVDLTVTPTNLAAVTHVHPNSTTVRFTRILTSSEMIFGPTTAVPLSECGLFIIDNAFFSAGVDIDIASPPSPSTPRLIAYQQFRTITKTGDISLQFDWELRF
jgi:hypothetical protein